MAAVASRRFRVIVTAGCGVVMAAGLLVAVPRLLAGPAGSHGQPYGTSVGTGTQQARKPGRAQTAGAGITALPDRTMPRGGWARVGVDAGAVNVGGVGVRLASAGVRLTAAVTGTGAGSRAAAAGSVSVQVLGQGAAVAAGVRGVVVTLSPGGAAAGQTVRAWFDYSSFANAYGADFGRRLRLVSLPACALTTPGVPACQAQAPMGSVNAGWSVSADVALPGARTGRGAAAGSPGVLVVALASTPASGGGTFTATSLSPAYSWSAGDQGGTFSTSYPLRVPASSGGPKPQLALQYDSGGVDGKTLAQNGQASWAGEGWDLQTGFIERSYRTCSLAGTGWPATPDLCLYSPDDVTMVFAGRSARLVWDGTKWHASDDSALKIDQVKGTGAAGAPGTNGTADHMYWRVTTLDGTAYFFGVNYRYAGDTAQTFSTQYQPVYLKSAGAPCGSKNWCQLGYRWNLDYVVDTSGNSMTYVYNQMTGRVGANNNTNNQPYVVTGTLDHIDYGTRAGSEATAAAPMRVTFTRANRCINTCAKNTSDYPDTPWDLYCSSTSSCSGTLSPVYFTPYQLAAVTTQVWTGTAYRKVDTWDLAYTFPATGNYLGGSGNDTAPSLWLNTVSHTGYAPDGTTSLADPVVSFGGTRMANRVDWCASCGVPPLMHYRLTQELNGMGGETDVGYNPAQCTPATAVALTGHADTNTYLCFPQYFKPATGSAGWGWFQKYTVASVTLKDLTGGSPDEVYGYAYSMAGSSTAAVWHHD